MVRRAPPSTHSLCWPEEASRVSLFQGAGLGARHATAGTACPLPSSNKVAFGKPPHVEGQVVDISSLPGSQAGRTSAVPRAMLLQFTRVDQP